MITFMDKLDSIHEDEKKCMEYLYKQWKDTKPLKNSKILINIHFTHSTLMLPLIFLSAGAELHMTCSNELVCHQDIKEIITDLGIYRAPDDILKNPQKHNYDVIIDCGGCFAQTLKPSVGFVELTHVDESCYRDVPCRVVSVDNSFIKFIETSYGTGDGFVRAIEAQYQGNNQSYHDRKFMVFGYGKVGEGICLCLEKSGVKKEDIIVIEINEFLINNARQKGFQSFSLIQQKDEILRLLETDINCAVTATGIQNSISDFFNEHDFNNTEYLVNMGTYDEWGEKFKNDRVLNNKRPFNFVLSYPTKVLYLDPIFALLACATLDIINDPPSSNTILQPPALETQKKILDVWLQNNPLRKDVEILWQKEKYFGME